MISILKSIHKIGNKFDKCAEQAAFHHPIIAEIGMFIGVPIFILAVVTICTMIIAFPLSLLFGWI
ncbi:MAG: hypothetical protein Q4F11_00815 [Eubacteriales bacterium]|nr:hypothetical protein [Eubacteriales bacterium]